VSDNLTERFIRLVLEELAPVGDPAEQVIGDLDVLSQDLQLPMADLFSGMSIRFPLPRQENVHGHPVPQRGPGPRRYIGRECIDPACRG
jgi:hypothetical protein